MTTLSSDIDAVHRDCGTHADYRPRGQWSKRQARVEAKRDKRRAVVDRVVERYARSTFEGLTTKEEAEAEIYGSFMTWGLLLWQYRALIWQAVKFLANRWYNNKYPANKTH